MKRFSFGLILAACIGMSLSVLWEGFVTPTAAQNQAANGGTLRGTITDTTAGQNPIEGVEVKIVSQDSGKEWTTKTDVDGNYKHAGLPAGRYLISISKDGYDKRVGKPVTIVAIVDGGDHFLPLKMAQKGNIEPLFEVQPIMSLPLGILGNISRRYNLDVAVLMALQRSMLDSIKNILEQGGGLHTFPKAVEEGSMSLLEVLLSYPDFKAALAKHLSEAQLQDYLTSTAARRQRDQQAVAHWITVTLDKQLSLTVDQREKVVKLLHGAASNGDFPASMSALRISSQKAVHLVDYILKISLDGILSDAQSKVWQGLVEANPPKELMVLLKDAGEVGDILVEADKNEGPVVIPKNPDGADKILVQADANKKRPFIRMKGVKHVEIWNETNPDTAESQDQMIQRVEAKLAAHTELLGSLDERAARRLALVTKGVAQQYIEAQGETPKAIDELWEDGSTKVDITDHPMYQQAIKDVLSEEAFAQYSAYQAKREVWHQQVLRDVIVACMDMQLLLDETQRETLETAASQLVPGPLKEKKSAEFMFFQLFPQTVNFEILTLWQQDEFKRVFGPMIWRR
ncbi:hypothetical protein C6503_05700 [Candidatus Poribacteria bacterium]|nr:MAG: hypothetical protein C6503_05700 [Candidatus Poribacteria bacterium]